MRIVRFLDRETGLPSLGAPRDDHTAELLEGEFPGLAPSGKLAAIGRLLPPIVPADILCIGLNYRDHAEESGSPIPTEPVCFSKFVSAITGPGLPIRLPKVAHEVDYEAELVVVIGRRGKKISEKDALGHVAGYMNGHDVSARDWQKGRPGGRPSHCRAVVRLMPCDVACATGQTTWPPRASSSRMPATAAFRDPTGAKKPPMRAANGTFLSSPSVRRPLIPPNGVVGADRPTRPSACRIVAGSWELGTSAPNPKFAQTVRQRERRA